MAKRKWQLTFKNIAHCEQRKTHGGTQSRRKRKSRRPLAIKKSHHVVLKAEKAVGRRCFLNHKKLVNRVLDKFSKRFQVRVYRLAINTNHLHLSIKGATREGIQNFFRVVAGHIAQEILRQYPLKKETGIARRGPKGRQPYKRKFWDDLVFSRVVEWGRDFRAVCRYILQNTMEAEGMIAYKPRTRKVGETSTS